MECPICGYYFEGRTDLCFACGWMLDYGDDNIGSGNSETNETRFDVGTDVDELVDEIEAILTTFDSLEEYYLEERSRLRNLAMMFLEIHPFYSGNLTVYGGVTHKKAWKP